MTTAVAGEKQRAGWDGMESSSKQVVEGVVAWLGFYGANYPVAAAFIARRDARAAATHTPDQRGRPACSGCLALALRSSPLS